MGIRDWLSQNWFQLFSTVGIIVSLWFAAVSIRAQTKTERISNLLKLTANHREVWREFSKNQELRRVLNPAADLAQQPVTDAEEMFVYTVLAQANSAYYAMSDQLVVEYDGLRQDIKSFLSLPIPKTVWPKAKPLQNHDFVTFVEAAMK